MNTLKFALLGTAAIAAVSVSAQASTASDVAALKAQVEALTAQVAAAHTAADLPSGYQFVSTSMQPSLLDPTRKAYTIAIMPTADAPASTVLQWTGFARAAFVYGQKNVNFTNAGALVDPAKATAVNDPLVDGVAVAAGSYSKSQKHIMARGELSVTGKTDTAVGEVGATLTFRNNWDGNNAVGKDLGWSVRVAKGWWALTPNLMLIGGFDGMTGGVGGYGTDKLNAFYTDGAPNSAGNPGDTSQFALAYADGPLSFKIAVGHYEGKDNNLTANTGLSDFDLALPANVTAYSDYAFGANAEYKGDAMSAKVAGWVHGGDYQVGVGATASMDMFTLSAAAAIGKDANHTFTRAISTLGGNWNYVEDATYWNANLMAGASLSDSVKAEIGVGYNQYTSTGGAALGGLTSDKLGVAGGLYYSPVSQLTVGAEASWNRETTNFAAPAVNNTGSTTAESITADLVTVFRF